MKKRVKKGVECVERAVADIRERYPTARGVVGIAWGYANKEEEKEAQENDLACHYQETEALLSWLDRDYQLCILRHGDPDYPDPCHISTDLEATHVLPRSDARKLFNVLERREDAVSLRLMPDNGADDTDSEIRILGVKTTIPIEGMTGRTLRDALSRLSLSVRVLDHYFAGQDDYDHWEMRGGE
jgi:hypothetical protein